MTSEGRRFRDGDAELFRSLVERYSPVVRAVVESFARDEDDIDDLIQDAWVAAFRRRRQYSGKGSLLAWILAVARNTAISRHRRIASRERTRTRYAQHAEQDSPPPDPVRRITLERRSQQLYRALMELPERQRMAIVLRVLEDRTPTETAEIMGIEKATVRSLVRRGVHRIRDAWEIDS